MLLNCKLFGLITENITYISFYCALRVGNLHSEMGDFTHYSQYLAGFCVFWFCHSLSQKKNLCYVKQCQSNGKNPEGADTLIQLL